MVHQVVAITGNMALGQAVLQVLLGAVGAVIVAAQHLVGQERDVDPEHVLIRQEYEQEALHVVGLMVQLYRVLSVQVVHMYHNHVAFHVQDHHQTVQVAVMAHAWELLEEGLVHKAVIQVWQIQSGLTVDPLVLAAILGVIGGQVHLALRVVQVAVLLIVLTLHLMAK